LPRRLNMQFRMLDVGCGVRPKGDVNIDLFPGLTVHRGCKARIEPGKIRNFIRADALHLPVRSKSFQIVYSNHVVEHVKDPVEFIREHLRVAKRKVIIITPHRYSRPKFLHRQLEAHKNFFSAKWFKKTLKNYRHTVKTTTRPLLHPILPFVNWMDEIIVEIYL